MKKLLTILFAVALGLNLSAQTACPPAQDANQDGVIGVDDLMDLLSHWGDTDFDFDGVYDSVDLCTDEGACNYLSNPTESCLYLDAIGACGGDCAEDTDGDGVCDDFYGPCQGESTVIYQDYTYDLVAIGGRCWFAENLRTELYQNGDSIPGDLNNSEWSLTHYTHLGAQAIYNNDAENLADYGRLYNLYAVDDERGLCPSGWQVPTDAEYTELTNYFGGDSIAGIPLRSSPTDNPSWNGTNASGFSGLAGGRKHAGGLYGNVMQFGYFWSASSYGTDLRYRVLTGVTTDFSWSNWYGARSGFSVRCVGD